jgi:hypothetical protein
MLNGSRSAFVFLKQFPYIAQLGSSNSISVQALYLLTGQLGSDLKNPASRISILWTILSREKFVIGLKPCVAQ